MIAKKNPYSQRAYVTLRGDELQINKQQNLFVIVPVFVVQLFK